MRSLELVELEQKTPRIVAAVEEAAEAAAEGPLRKPPRSLETAGTDEAPREALARRGAATAAFALFGPEHPVGGPETSLCFLETFPAHPAGGPETSLCF